MTSCSIFNLMDLLAVLNVAAYSIFKFTANNIFLLLTSLLE